MTEEVAVAEFVEPPPRKTFLQAVYEGAKQAANSVNAEELRGISKDQFLEAVRLVTQALGTMPEQTSMHAALYAVTYMRNAIILALQEGQARMAQVAEPNA